MKFLKMIFILIFSTSLLSQNSRDEKMGRDYLNIEHRLEDYVRENNVPAFSAALVVGDSITYFNYGITERNNGFPVSENSMYQIASLSKTFTGIIANNLLLEGELDIDKSILDYLPEVNDENSKKSIENITIKDLLHHSSGYLHDGDLQPTPFDRKSKPYSEKALINDLTNKRKTLDEAYSFSYSNYGYALLGLICERVSGQDYKGLINEYLITPYGLSQVSLSHLEIPEITLVYPYSPKNRSKKLEPWVAGKSVASGGLYTSSKDLATLAIKQLSAYTNLENYTNDVLLLTNDLVKVDGNTSYGYGLFKKEISADMTALYHGGDLFGFSSQYRLYPKQSKALILLTSSGGKDFMGLTDSLEKLFLGLKERKEVKLTKYQLKPLMGTYKFSSGQLIKLKLKKGNLLSYGDGISTLVLHPTSETYFFYKELDGAFQFEISNEQVIKATYIQNGEEFPIIKIK